MSQQDYLTAMGISTWVLQEPEVPNAPDVPNVPEVANTTPTKADVPEAHQIPVSDQSAWTFVVDQLQGDGNLLFDKILASLMLSRSQVQVISSSQALAGQASGQVILAMGAELSRKLLQIDEPFEELRGAIHSLEAGEMEWPVVLTYHPEHLLKHPIDKAKTWQDLILARSLI